MTLFYAPDISSQECILSEDEAKHAIKVLRLSAGDEILLTDGKGKRYYGELEGTDIRNCKIKIVKEVAVQQKRAYRLHIAIAPTKSTSRLEWFMEKSTEIGIDSITPIVCEHSERRKLQSNRLNKILVGAMKQSNQDILPELHPIINYKEFLTSLEVDAKNTFMASYDKENQDLAELINTGQNTLIIIGPEGDFSKLEKQMAREKGIAIVNLGKTRLRTETAGIVAVHSAALINGGAL